MCLCLSRKGLFFGSKHNLGLKHTFVKSKTWHAAIDHPFKVGSTFLCIGSVEGQGFAPVKASQKTAGFSFHQICEESTDYWFVVHNPNGGHLFRASTC